MLSIIFSRDVPDVVVLLDVDLVELRFAWFTGNVVLHFHRNMSRQNRQQQTFLQHRNEHTERNGAHKPHGKHIRVQTRRYYFSPLGWHRIFAMIAGGDATAVINVGVSVRADIGKYGLTYTRTLMPQIWCRGVK